MPCDPQPEGPYAAAIDAILRGARLGLTASAGHPVEAGEPWARPAGRVGHQELSLVTGFGGEVVGQVKLGARQEAALRWASAASGNEFEAFDDEVVAALLDAMGVVVGAIANELARCGLLVHFTEPTLTWGPGSPLAWPHVYVQEVPLTLAIDDFVLAIGLEVAPTEVGLGAIWPPSGRGFAALVTETDAEGWLVRIVPVPGG